MKATVDVGVSDSLSLQWALPVRQSVQPMQPSIRLGGEDRPAWATPVVNRIIELAALPTVDPHGSRPLDVQDVVEALRFLGRNMQDDTLVPWIGRLSSGGLQLTWRCGDIEVEAVFDQAREDHEVIVTVGDSEWDEPVSEADSLFATVVDRLSNSHFEYIAGS